MIAEIENAVLLRHGAQASVRVLRLMQGEFGNSRVPWFWLALKLPGEREQLIGRRRTCRELLSLVENPRYQRLRERRVMFDVATVDRGTRAKNVQAAE